MRIHTLILLLLAGMTGFVRAEKQVFAHYMVCFATYGSSVEAYQREIVEAQAAGVDGFALNVGAWSGPDWYYKARVKSIYDAAEGLNSGFKLFFSLELTNTVDLREILSTYGNRPNSLKKEGKTVVSTYGQNNTKWAEEVFGPLKEQGMDFFFVPHFWPDPVQELPSYQDGKNILKKYGNLLDGLFLFGAAGMPHQLAQCNSNYARATREEGKLFMAGITPHYWGAGQEGIGRRYFEFHGGEGLELQWKGIIQSQPEWVELVTWNDWNESTYFCPVDDPGKYFESIRNIKRHTHSGYMEFSKRYIQWFKTGVEPGIVRDELYYSYRTHPKTAVVTNDSPVRWFIGDVQDTVYTTLLLTAPASVEIFSGSSWTTNSAAAGISHFRTGFLPGEQRFVVRRNGSVILSTQGPPITAEPEKYNFFPTTGFAFAAPKIKPPENLRIEPGSSPN
ncbi:MAG: endo-1,3-alpha-glucanase family glycosylhydrolase [Verrucomicrobiota bacterium]|nr:endo-1,3-alpha-glucanase family glycosylhydrolase [Verrucomicrobiota bacterium]